jgi:Ca-activated chloride channel family protein
MTFLNPYFFLFILVPVGFVGYFLLRKTPLPKRLISATPDALKKATRSTRYRVRALFFFSMLGLAAMVAAMARPVREISMEKRHVEGIDIALVVDISESMEATDFSPNRMEVSKSVIRDFIKRRNQDRIALVLFGGEAVTKSPLTYDYPFLLQQIDDIRFRELKQGTAIGMGLLGGISRLRNSKSKNRVIILFTDGDSNVGTINPITAAHLARQEHIRVYTIGIGQKDRVVVSIYSYDLEGRRTQLIAQVPSYLNPELLKQIAQMTGAKAYMARDANMLSRFVREIDSLEKTPIRVQSTRKSEELYRIPLLLSLCLTFFVIVLMETRFRIHSHAT